MPQHHTHPRLWFLKSSPESNQSPQIPSNKVPKLPDRIAQQRHTNGNRSHPGTLRTGTFSSPSKLSVTKAVTVE